jgi:hypothetical protein
MHRCPHTAEPDVLSDVLRLPEGRARPESVPAGATSVHRVHLCCLGRLAAIGPSNDNPELLLSTGEGVE